MRFKKQAIAIACVLCALFLSGCPSSVFIDPAKAVKPPFKDMKSGGFSALNYEELHAYKLRILRAYNDPETHVVFPRSAWFQTLGSGMTMLSAFAKDIGQKVQDQQMPPWMRTIRLTAQPIGDGSCDAAEVGSGPSPYGLVDMGNPPEPGYSLIRIPVPREYAWGGTIEPAMFKGTECEKEGERSDSYVCLYGKLAMQKPKDGKKSNLIILVHGLLDSSDQHYMRDPAAVLFSMGFSVLLLDMRDHGQTYRSDPTAPTTFGLYEANDLVVASQTMRRYRSCAGRIDKIGLLGFSVGGLTAMRAFIQDRKHPPPSGMPYAFDGGVMALSPPHDISGTLSRIKDVNDQSPVAGWGIGRTIDTPLIAADPELVEESLSYALINLFRIRWNALADAGLLPKKGRDERLDPLEYLELRTLKAYPNLRKALSAIQVSEPIEAHAEVEKLLAFSSPKNMADEFLHTRVTGVTDRLPYLAIVTSKDDFVVGGDGAEKIREAFSEENVLCNFRDGDYVLGSIPVCIYETEVGGHIAFNIISQELARHFLRTYMCHQADCP